MAFFDPDSGKLVLQIVYDGAPFSGKTASIEGLGQLFDRPVLSPQIADGRTLMFDWLEYEGGTRYGRPIICRVLTVPGQSRLAQRRLKLLRDADGIIFVVDSCADVFARTLEHWTDLQTLIEQENLNAAVTVQINKRDLDSALPVAEVLENLGYDPSHRYFETEAVHRKGVREAFVISVGETIRHLNKVEPRRQLEAKGDQGLPATPKELVDVLHREEAVVQVDLDSTETVSFEPIK